MQELKGRDTRKFMVNRGIGDGGGRSEEGSDLKSARDSESDEEVSMGIGGGLRRKRGVEGSTEQAGGGGARQGEGGGEEGMEGLGWFGEGDARKRQGGLDLRAAEGRGEELSNDSARVGRFVSGEREGPGRGRGGGSGGVPIGPAGRRWIGGRERGG